MYLIVEDKPKTADYLEQGLFASRVRDMNSTPTPMSSMWRCASPAASQDSGGRDAVAVAFEMDEAGGHPLGMLDEAIE